MCNVFMWLWLCITNGMQKIASHRGIISLITGVVVLTMIMTVIDGSPYWGHDKPHFSLDQSHLAPYVEERMISMPQAARSHQSDRVEGYIGRRRNANDSCP